MHLGTTLGIGDTELVTVALDRQVPAGPWDAQISLHSGLLERSARATITFPDHGVGPPVPVSPERSRWPYLGAAGTAVVLLALIVFWRRRY